MSVIPAIFPDEKLTVAELIREYAEKHGVNIDFQELDAEIAALPGEYARPLGTVLLATMNGAPIGCVAMRPLTNDICEMKRLFVRDAGRGLGIGKRLCNELLVSAAGAGYSTVRLDTLLRKHIALTLYESLGFTRIPAYNDNPLPDVVHLERSLSTLPSQTTEPEPTTDC